MQNLSFENEFDLREKELVSETSSYERFNLKTRFEIEAKGNSKMVSGFHMFTFITAYQILFACLAYRIQ